jgi:TrmH family RNA methyltransferase
MSLEHVVRVVLVEPQTPGNVGAVARALANFGISQLCLVTATPSMRLEKEAVRRARGGQHLLEGALCVGSLQEALHGMDWVMGFTARGGRDRGDAVPVRDGVARARLATRVAAVFGREDDGLHTAEMQRCDALVTIPTRDESSLNLSHAVAVFAHEWNQATLPPRATQVASQASRLTFMADVEELMFRSNFLNGARPRRPATALHRLLDRALPNPRELRILHGVVKRVLERLPRR